MRLPRITIEYQEEETCAPGKLSFALIAGFGLHWAWVYLFMFDGAQLFSLHPAETPPPPLLFPVSLASFAAALLCYGLFLEPVRTLFGTAEKRSRNRLIAAASVLASMLLAIGGNLFPAAQPAFIIAAGLLSGVGSAALLMSYGVSFSVCDLATTVVCTAASLPISALCFVAVSTLGEAARPLGIMACLALPCAELICLRICSHQLVDNLEFTSITIPVNMRSFALHVCAPSLVFGFALGFIRTKAVLSLDETPDPTAAMLTVGCASLLAAGLLVLGMLTQRQSNNFAFRTLMPVAAVLLSSLVVPGADESPWKPFALFCSYLMLEASMWIMYADISQRFRISAFTVFGFGRSLMALGTLAAHLLSQSGGMLHAATYETETLIAVLFSVVTFGVALLPTNRELRKTLRRGRLCPAFVDLEDEPLRALFEGTVARGTNEGANADDADKREAGTGMEKNSAQKIAGDMRNAQSERGDASEAGGADVQPARRDRAGRGDEDACDDASDAERADALSHAEAALAEATAEQDAQRTAGRFKRKCSSVAERYLLSRKETEVLYLLAKGRKSAVIQECLYISEGTANTHMRHIYRKLDVHSQQELMDLVEAEPLEDESPQRLP